MEKQEALDFLKKHIKHESLIKHSLASYAVMEALANKLGQDVNLWALAGLLHDIDYELTADDVKMHGKKAREMLEGKLPEEAICAIEAHNEYAEVRPRQRALDFALAAGESITGLIVATSLVYPDKKVASVKVKSITKRMKEKSFAAAVSHETIMECEKLAMTLDEFTAVCLEGMQKHADELGL